MWWSSTGIRVVAVAAIVAVLGGCGFRPLYGATDAETDVPEGFSTVAIAPISNRVGQQLRNYLLDMLTPRGRPTNPVYTLKVRVDERIRNFAIDSAGVGTRANLRLDADYWLVKDDNGKTVVNGESLAVSSYNLVKAEFSNLTAQNDARSRAAQHIARQIRTRLGAFFAQHQNTAAQR